MNKKMVKKLCKQLKKATLPILVKAPYFPPSPSGCFYFGGRVFHHRVLSTGQDEFYTVYPNQEDCPLCVRKHETLRNNALEMEKAFMFGRFNEAS